MSRPIEQASFDGIPLQSLRGLAPDDFIEPLDLEPPVYIYEDDSSRSAASDRPYTYTPYREFDTTLGSRFARPLYQPEFASSLLRPTFGNEKMPVTQSREAICEAVRDNSVFFIDAPTGSGKSTQVAQMLYSAGWTKIITTQPRRIAARNVYERIQTEMAAVVGSEEASQLVSYWTAGKTDRRGSPDAPIQIATDGLVILRDILDKDIPPGTVIVVDEAHEENTNIEVTLGLLKEAVRKNPSLRVVIMSATANSFKYANFFADATPAIPPIIEIKGRNFAVKKIERPESTIVDETIFAAQEIYSRKAPEAKKLNCIQTFVSGVREINDAIHEIRRRLPPELRKAAKILPLHAGLSEAEQQAVMRSYPGVKIVVTTNVAETSLTIPDTSYVIDSGQERREELDYLGNRGLAIHDISQANCDQRAGRAGRVSGDGTYVLTRPDKDSPFTSYINREKFPVPEVLRTDIVRTVLRLRARGIDFAKLDTPNKSHIDPEYIESAEATLRTLGAFGITHTITPTGLRMDKYPIAVTSGRMMVEAGKHSERIRAYMAAIAASKEVGGLPNFSYGIGIEWKKFTEEDSSDLLAGLDIFIASQDMTQAQLRQNDLAIRNVTRAREQYQKIARTAGADVPKLLPPTPEERDILKECIYAGLVTSVYRHNGLGRYLRIGKDDVERELSKRSFVKGHPQYVVGEAYRVEYKKDGAIAEKHLIENVTVATRDTIGRAAMHLVETVPVGFSRRGGQYVEVRKKMLFDIDLFEEIEIEATPSPQLRDRIIQDALREPGAAQKELRVIKKALEDLADLAKDAVPQLTQATLIHLIEAAASEDIIHPSTIENNLRGIIQQNNISLDSYVPVERRERIYQNAPAHFMINEAGGISLPIEYSRGQARVRQQDWDRPDMLAALAVYGEEFQLPDGRQIYFMEGNKRRSLLQIQAKVYAGV